MFSVTFASDVSVTLLLPCNELDAILECLCSHYINCCPFHIIFAVKIKFKTHNYTPVTVYIYGTKSKSTILILRLDWAKKLVNNKENNKKQAI